jgi:hypothetical protein
MKDNNNKKDLSFSSLIREIDAKWGHTYEKVSVEQELEEFTSVESGVLVIDQTDIVSRLKW